MPDTIIFKPDGSREVIPGPAINPDDTPDEDVLILRRVVQDLAERIGLTKAEVRALFRAAKRRVD